MQANIMCENTANRLQWISIIFYHLEKFMWYNPQCDRWQIPSRTICWWMKKILVKRLYKNEAFRLNSPRICTDCKPELPHNSKQMLQTCHDPHSHRDNSQCEDLPGVHYFYERTCSVPVNLTTQQFVPICFICEISNSHFTGMWHCSKFERENIA